MSQEASTQLKDLKEKIKDVKFGMFTTLDPDGKLSSRPMTSQQLRSEERRVGKECRL